jgi:hypothetical protein
MTREEVRNRFPAGTEVMAVIYKLRHIGVWEPQRAVVHSVVSEDEIRKGYRFGIRVLYNEDELHWVSSKDVMEIE